MASLTKGKKEREQQIWECKYTEVKDNLEEKKPKKNIKRKYIHHVRTTERSQRQFVQSQTEDHVTQKNTTGGKISNLDTTMKEMIGGKKLPRFSEQRK